MTKPPQGMLSDEQRREAARITTVLADLGYYFTFGASGVPGSDPGPAWRLTLTPPEDIGDGPAIEIDLALQKPWVIIAHLGAKTVPEAAYLPLLQLNSVLVLARIAITPEGQLVAWAQTYFNNLNTSAMQDAIGAVIAAVIEARKITAKTPTAPA